LNEQVPRSEEIRKLAEAKMKRMLRSFLGQRQDQIQPDNLELTVFIVGKTIEALTHGAVLDRPELIKDGELEKEITILLSSYLLKS
jgi:hypothetical protein